MRDFTALFYDIEKVYSLTREEYEIFFNQGSKVDKDSNESKKKEEWTIEHITAINLL